MKLLNKLKNKVKSMISKKNSPSVGGIKIPIIPFNLNMSKHTTVPAPKVLVDDEWFGPAVISDSNKDYMERETKAKKIEEKYNKNLKKELKDIHQKMYEISTKNYTTIQIDPPGGSENHHERMSSWDSGKGILNRN
jgi:predicted metal-dependent hydrolase|tara:strand:+ start:2002 stop:2409 length:408 start_codon:yes stop_codon:yes gene_type:complete